MAAKALNAIGQYDRLEQLDSGGMGTVYRARDPRFDRTVAVKVLHPHLLSDAGLVERFKAEAVIQAKLNHPHIVSVLDFVVDDGLLAIVMEYLEGRTLASLLYASTGPLPVARATHLLDQVLAAVGFAHAHGLIHRDLKPANVLVIDVGGRDHAKVLDFGIAKILGTDKQKTATAATMGTLAYMSPEQVRSPKGVDARSDIYALGVMLYELVSGRLPYAGESDYDVMQAIVSGPPPDISVLPPAVSPAVRAVIARATAKEPLARFQSCEEMRAALADAEAGRLSPGQTAAWISAAPARSDTTTGTSVTPQTVTTSSRAAAAQPSRSGRKVALPLAAVAVIVAVAGAVAYPRLMDEADWRTAWQANTLEAVDGYLSAHTDGTYRRDAEFKRSYMIRQRDEQAWRRTGGTVDELRSYLASWPSGVHAAEARVSLDQLMAGQARAEQEAVRRRRDDQAWTVALSANTAESLGRYLDEFPGGVHANEAAALRDALQRAEAEPAAQPTAEYTAQPSPAGPSFATPAAASPPPPPAPTTEMVEVVVPVKTPLRVRLRTSLSSEDAKVESPVDAVLESPVVIDGRTAVASGSRVTGTVVDVERGGKFKTRARLAIRFHRLDLPDGNRHDIRTESVVQEGEQPQGAAKVATGAAVGALIGGLLGGGKGAAIGAAGGAGGGTVSAEARARLAAKFASGSVLDVGLSAPLRVVVEVPRR